MNFWDGSGCSRVRRWRRARLRRHTYNTSAGRNILCDEGEMVNQHIPLVVTRGKFVDNSLVLEPLQVQELPDLVLKQ